MAGLGRRNRVNRRLFIDRRRLLRALISVVLTNAFHFCSNSGPQRPSSFAFTICPIPAPAASMSPCGVRPLAERRYDRLVLSRNPDGPAAERVTASFVWPNPHPTSAGPDLFKRTDTCSYGQKVAGEIVAQPRVSTADVDRNWAVAPRSTTLPFSLRVAPCGDPVATDQGEDSAR